MSKLKSEPVEKGMELAGEKALRITGQAVKCHGPMAAMPSPSDGMKTVVWTGMNGLPFSFSLRKQNNKRQAAYAGGRWLVVNRFRSRSRKSISSATR